MSTAQTAELLRRLRIGQLDATDVAYLEQLKADELLADVAPVYPLHFQERHLSRKWEVGRARSLHFELVPRFFPGSEFPSLSLIPVLAHCLMLSGEGEAVTGISMSLRIIIRPI